MAHEPKIGTRASIRRASSSTLGSSRQHPLSTPEALHAPPFRSTQILTIAFCRALRQRPDRPRSERPRVAIFAAPGSLAGASLLVLRNAPEKESLGAACAS